MKTVPLKLVIIQSGAIGEGLASRKVSRVNNAIGRIMPKVGAFKVWPKSAASKS